MAECNNSRAASIPSFIPLVRFSPTIFWPFWTSQQFLFVTVMTFTVLFLTDLFVLYNIDLLFILCHIIMWFSTFIKHAQNLVHIDSVIKKIFLNRRLKSENNYRSQQSIKHQGTPLPEVSIEGQILLPKHPQKYRHDRSYPSFIIRQSSISTDILEI